MFQKKYTLRLKLYLLLVVAAFPGSTLVFGQSPEYKNYSVKDGLPSSEVYNSIQDSKGFMWFATDKGVCRFDGYQFRVFTTINGLADNTVFSCQEDYKGRIWFRSFSGKLSYYYNDSIYQSPLNDTLSRLVKTSFVMSMTIDTTDNIYMGVYCSYLAVIKINIKTNSISLVPIPRNKSYLIMTPDKRLLIGNTYDNTNSNLNKIKANVSGIYIYRLTSGSSELLKIKQYDTSILNGFTIHDQALLLANNKIALMYNNRIFLLDTISWEFKSLHDFKGENILSISKDGDQGFWLSTQKKTIYFNNERITNRHLPEFLSEKSITSVTKDNEGGTWFTTLYGGIYYVSSLSFKTYSTLNGLPGNKINTITVSKDGKIWAATEYSNKISVINNDSITYRYLPDVKGLSINTILLNDSNEVWVSTTSGLSIFKNNRYFKLISKSDAVGQYNIINNNNGTSWANNYSRLQLLKRKGNIIYGNDLQTCGSKIFSICKDSNQSIWMGTFKGLFRYYKDSLYYYGKKNALLKNRINDIKMLPNGNLWLITRNNGIIVKRGDSLNEISTKDGLLSNFCQCACIDKAGNIWVGTNKGISHIILSKSNSGNLIDTIINLTGPNLIEVNCIKSNNDTIYAATSNGITLFNTNTIFSSKTPPPIYITEIKINNQTKPLSSSFHLNYDENYLMINFVGLTYKDAGNTQYRYKMEGIDTGWIYTKNRDVQYPKIASGNYTFLVSAMNTDGVWNLKPASVKFNISPPFWATWWARTIFVLTIAGFIYWRFKVVETRTKHDAEVNKQLISMELKELKAQMDPHFLFNNLNTLTQLVEVKSDDAPEFVEELSKYYRYSLQFRNTEFTSLDNELKQADRYLHILKIRFGDNIKLQWNILESLRTHYIATYSLQLLLENITKHNIVSISKPIWVEITTTNQGSLVIKNQSQPKNSSILSNKHGLKSIDQRYQLLTSKKIVVSQTSEYFSVELPLITPTEYESTYS